MLARFRSWKLASGLVVILAILYCNWSPSVQSFAVAQTEAGLKRSLTSFATARGLNAVISVVQGTEVSVEPLGVGVTLTLGQLLDPINDLVEQFSTLMLWSSVSFGVQVALLKVTGHWLVSVALTAVLATKLLLLFVGKRFPSLDRALMLLMLVRLAVPGVAVASDLVYRQFLAQDYVEQQRAVEDARTKTVALAARQGASEASKTEAQTWIERLKERVGSPWSSAKSSVESIRSTLEGLAERIVRLMVVFVVQTLLLPLAFIWLLYRAIWIAFRLPVAPASGAT
jgi:hypothetical protein